MGISLSDKSINKYFRFLSRLDNRSKKKLINRLTDSIEDNEKSNQSRSFSDLSGQWEDERHSDDIIKDIRDSRVNRIDDIKF